jgi:hypothetical protein
MKNDIKRMLQSTFPELESVCEVFSEMMLQFLREFPSARLIQAAPPPEDWQSPLSFGPEKKDIGIG